MGALRTRRAATRLLGSLIAVSIVAHCDAEGKPKKKRKNKKPCKAPNKKCGVKCITVQSDDNNCGACGNRCSRTQVCRAGQCEALLPPVDCPNGQCCEDNEVCDGDGRCRDEECQPKPNCLSAGEFLPLFGETPPCCSDEIECSINEQSGMSCICEAEVLSRPCLRNGDCLSGSCVGYQCVCPRATCQSLGKQCGTWNDGCGGTVDCGNCGIGAKSVCAAGMCKTCSEVYGACNKAIHTTSGWIQCAMTVDSGNCDEPCETDADCGPWGNWFAYSFTAGGVTTPSCPTVAKTCIHADVCVTN